MTGKKIIEATGWPSGSAAWRVGKLAERLGLDVAWERRENSRQVANRLVGKPAKKQAAKKAPAPKAEATRKPAKKQAA